MVISIYVQQLMAIAPSLTLMGIDDGVTFTDDEEEHAGCSPQVQVVLDECIVIVMVSDNK